MKSIKTLCEDAIYPLLCLRGRYWDLGCTQPFWLWLCIRNLTKFLMDDDPDFLEVYDK